MSTAKSFHGLLTEVVVLRYGHLYYYKQFNSGQKWHQM